MDEPGDPAPTAADPAASKAGLAVLAPPLPSWLWRIAERLGIGGLGLGLLVLGSVLLVFLLTEAALGRFAGLADSPSRFGRMQITVTHIFVAAYLCGAYLHALVAHAQTTRALREAEPSEEPAAIDPRALRWATLVGVVTAVVVTSVTPGGFDNLDPRRWNIETIWHRAFAVVICVLLARLVAVLTLQSVALSRSARRLSELDLLDPSALAPFTRQGLTNALLIAGFAAVFTLFLVDLRYLGILRAIIPFVFVVASIGLLAPLLGARDRVRAAKRSELHWCRERLRAARAARGRGETTADRLEELIAWESRIEAVREWPIDAPVLSRFVLYLLIPLLSWSGGALVERLIDSALE